MSTVLDLHAPGSGSVPSLLARLVDNAALFPPDSAPMAETVAAHLAARDEPNGDLVGFLLCPVSRLGELVTELRKVQLTEPVALSLVADTGLGGLPKAISTALDNPKLLSTRLVEVPAASDVDATWLVQLTEFVPDDVVKVVEPRRGRPEWLTGVRLVADAGCWPKLRCGGVSTESFPTVDEVADFLAIACQSKRSFKATAGLNHVVRIRDESTGLTHHGLLNMLVATARALAGGDVREALASTDATALADEAQGLSEAAARKVREVFASYGSVSLHDPLVELQRLELL